MSRGKRESDQLEVERIWNESTELILKEKIVSLQDQVGRCKAECKRLEKQLESEYARGNADAYWEMKNHPLQKDRLSHES